MTEPRSSFQLAGKARMERILGIDFFIGEADAAIDKLQLTGGLLVVPAGPALVTLPHDVAYRNAILGADLVIADSAFMVQVWNLTHRPAIKKLSGLKYLRALLLREDFQKKGNTLWVMPNAKSAAKNLAWLQEQRIQVDFEDVYLAPLYKGDKSDPMLEKLIELRRPRHVVLCIGGGTQEPLGYSLRRNLSYRPSIHCVGAAIGFLSGDQVHIPEWVDRWGLCWLWRTVSKPSRFLPRYWSARKLAGMLIRHGRELPPLAN